MVEEETAKEPVTNGAELLDLDMSEPSQVRWGGVGLVWWRCDLCMFWLDLNVWAKGESLVTNCSSLQPVSTFKPLAEDGNLEMVCI